MIGVRELTVEFGPVRALDGVSLDITPARCTRWPARTARARARCSRSSVAARDLFTIIDGAPRRGGVRRHACDLVIRGSSAR